MYYIFYSIVSKHSVPIDTSLNSYIRNDAQLRGTKYNCSEGGCGACTVTLRGRHPITDAVVSKSVVSVSITNIIMIIN